MEPKYATLYSNIKKKKWEGDIVSLPISTTSSFIKRWNTYMYNDFNKFIHSVRFVNKEIKTDLFYFNEYKTITPSIIPYLPFDTEHFITQEVPGISVFATKIDGRRYIYTKYGQRNEKLEKLLRTELEYNYLIDKYANDIIIELKLYNDELYIINVFTSNEIFPFSKLKEIANKFNCKLPKKIRYEIFSKGKTLLDRCYNDYYLNTDNHLPHINFYLTFIFQNNKYLLYKQ